MMNHVNPLMSYAEVRVPFPASNSLWKATTAETWKASWLRAEAEKPSGKPGLALSDAVRISISQIAQADLNCETILHALYGFWGLVWEQQQFREAMQSGDVIGEDELPDTTNLMLSARREPLLKAFNVFRGRLAAEDDRDREFSTKEPMMLLEYLSMVLHVPIQGVHAFAGRDGEREARRVYPLLQEWVQSKDARQGIWHAGQILRAAKAHSSRDMRDLRIVFVYQASITLWVYGVILKASRLPSRSLSLEDNNSEGLVWLDGKNKDAAVRKFIAIGEGTPVLNGVVDGTMAEKSTCLVEDASSTMRMIIRILKKPIDCQDGAQLGLVESTTKLMVEIAKVADTL
jgi:hypothetical protein